MNMTTKKKSKKEDQISDNLIIDENLSDRTKELLNKIIHTQNKPYKFVFRIPEKTEKYFILNKVIGIEENKDPDLTWEIESSFMGSEYSKSARKISNSLRKIFLATKNEEDFTDQTDAITKINSRISDLESQYQTENIKLKEILYNLIISFNQKEKIQFIPVDIFLDTNDSQEIFSVYESIQRYLEVIGFENAFDFKSVTGSWYKKMVAKSKKLMTDEEVLSRLKEVEYGVEVNTILQKQSEIDKNQSEALLNILKSVENIPNAAIRIGSLIVVKLTDERTRTTNVQVRSLSILEMHTLNKNPELLKNPHEILNALANAISKNKEISNN
jgi:hypothetical protein